MAKSNQAATQAATQAAPEKAPFTVTQVPVNHDGTVYDVGQTVDLTAEQAARLGGLVAPADVPATN